MGVELRPIIPSDRDELKALHEEWFPVKYSDSFYENVVHGFADSERRPIVGLMAIEKKQQIFHGDGDGIEQENERVTLGCVIFQVNSLLSHSLFSHEKLFFSPFFFLHRNSSSDV